MYSTVFRHIVNLQLSTIIFKYVYVQMLIDQTVQHLHWGFIARLKRDHLQDW